MTAEVVQEQNLPMVKPITSWSPPDIRENTELTKEPTLYLDLNYGSDGDVDMVELHDSVSNLSSYLQPFHIYYVIHCVEFQLAKILICFIHFTAHNRSYK